MRQRILSLIVDYSVNRRPIVLWTTVIVTIVLAAASTRLRMDVRWSTLLPESMPVVAEFKKIDRDYLQPHNMIVAITGPNRQRLETITDEVTSLLRDQLVCNPNATSSEAKASGRYARHVYGGLPEDWLTEHSLRLLKEKDARRAADRLRDPRLVPFLTHLNDDFEREYSDADNVRSKEREIVSVLDAVQRLVVRLQEAVDGDHDVDLISDTVRDLTIGSPYLLSLDRQMSLVMVASAIPSDDFEAIPLMDKKVESLLKPLAAQHPEFTFERTGLTAIGRDELDSVGPQTMAITAAAILLVFVLLAWNYRSIAVPVVALLPLVIGIVWALGIISLVLGEMNLFTSMIMVVLIGLGIDFSIHLTNRFSEEAKAGRTIEEALRATLGETGLAVSTGAFTTAVAFLMLMLAGTTGIKEFGFCAGIGVLTTLAAVLWILPALLARRAERRLKVRGRAAELRSFDSLGRLAEWTARHRWLTSGIVLGLTLLCCWRAADLEMEWNFTKLEPAGLRSVELQDEIVDRYKLSTTVSMLTAPTVEESRSLRKQFKDSRLVGEVSDVSRWVSRPDFEDSLAHLRRLRAETESDRPPLRFASPAPDPAVTEPHRQHLHEELDRLWANLVEIQSLSFSAGQDRIVEKTEQLVARRDAREHGPLLALVDEIAKAGDLEWQLVDDLATVFQRELEARVTRMIAGLSPLSLADVPPDIAAQFVSDRSPGYLMTIMPKKNLYVYDDLVRFRDMSARLHPNVTGTPQMFLEMNVATLREGRLVFGVALGVIFLLLLADFRRPLIAGMCLLPLIVGAALTLGIVAVLGAKLNYVNLIGFPVILGIGVDNGVHFMHRLRQEGPNGLSRAVTSVGQAMVMSSITTMVGFGSLMFYLMRGMASMGMVLFVGVGACLVVTLTLLPALATILEARVHADSSAARRAALSRKAKMGIGAVIVVGLLATAGPVAAQSSSAAEILKNCDVVVGYDSSYGQLRQVITTTGGAERTLVLRSWAIDDGDKQLAEYLAPADVKGQRILMTNDGDDIWMFNAETRRTRKLGSHMKRKRIMGTDFTYEDQAGGKISRKYTGTVIGEENIDGVACHVLDLTPTSEGPSYSRIRAWIAKRDHVTRRVDYYREGEEAPFKRLRCEDVRQVDDKLVPFKMTMTNLVDGTSTVNLIDEIHYHVDIPELVFDPRSLGR